MRSDEWRNKRGPWTCEPDELEFTHAGLACYICRGPCGNLNGYVGIPAGHPLWGCEYSQSSPALREAIERRKEMPIGETPAFGLMLAALTGEVNPTPEIALVVHGGVTYSDNHRPNAKPDDLWWFGFDTAHAGDWTPGLTRFREEPYRDIGFVRAETERLAEQLAALSAPPVNEATRN